MSISRAPATLGLTTSHQIARSDWTNDFLAPRSCWAPIVQLPPSLISRKKCPCFLEWFPNPGLALHPEGGQ